MADVQLEHGFTRIAHALLRALMRAKLSEREKSVVLCVMDRTYGAPGSPTRAKIGSSAIAHDLGIPRQTATAITAKLVAYGVLGRECRERSRAVLWVEKDFDRWSCGFRVRPELTPLEVSDDDSDLTPPEVSDGDPGSTQLTPLGGVSLPVDNSDPENPTDTSGGVSTDTSGGVTTETRLKSQPPGPESPGGDPVPGTATGVPPPRPPEDPRELVWRIGVELMGDRSRSLIGKLVKQHGAEAVAKVLAGMAVTCPAEPRAYLVAALERGSDWESPQEGGYGVVVR